MGHEAIRLLHFGYRQVPDPFACPELVEVIELMLSLAKLALGIAGIACFLLPRFGPGRSLGYHF